MDILTILFRILHIFAAVFWVGAAWLVTFFVAPAAAALGPDGGKFMGALSQRKMPIYISIAAVVTLLAGFALYYTRIVALGLSSTTAGMVFGFGGLVGLIAGGVGGGIVGPTTTKMAALGAEIARGGKPPTQEQAAQLAALQKRLASASLWNAILVTLALLAMATARYL